MRHLLRRPGPAAVRGVVVLALLGMVGCSDAVEVASPTVDREGREACRAFLDALPPELDGASRREVEPSEALSVAWGDPAVVVTCGAGAPEGFDEFSPCEEVDGVGWYAPEDAADDPTSDVVLTTIGVKPRVAVAVPSERRPPAGILVAVGAVVREQLGVREPCV